MNNEIELSDGIFIEYNLSDIGGIEHCTDAQWNCTFECDDQISEFTELREKLGLGDNVSLKMYVDQKVCGLCENVNDQSWSQADYGISYIAAH